MKAIITLSFLWIFNVASSQQLGKFADNHVIIKIKQSSYVNAEIDLSGAKTGIIAIDNLNSELGISKLESIGNHRRTRTFLIEFSDNIDVPTALIRYKSLQLLDYAEPDYIGEIGGQKGEIEIIPDDTDFNKQWGLFNDGTMLEIGTTVADADVDMDLAWDIQTGDPEMIIAVSDSGLRLNHPDIASRIWNNPNEIPSNGIDDDENGYIDDIRGWDWKNNDATPSDDMGHGTNVAGIIGCVANNNSMFVGANWNSKLMILRVIGADNLALYSAMANSIYYAVDNGAKVFSMSLGGGAANVIADAVDYTEENNVIFVACMMNFNDDTPYYPAAYSTTNSNMIAVGSTDPDDKRTSPFFWDAASGSNFGEHLNVVAPGNFIYSLNHSSNTNADTYWGGTSQATPLVAGIASLILAQNPNLTPSEVRLILQDTAEDQVGDQAEDTPGYDQYMGFGRVNAFAALQAAELSVNDLTVEKSQELKIINPERKGILEVFSKGKFIGNYSVSVNSMDGKLLHSDVINIKAGNNTIKFDLPAGTYMVTFKNENYSKIFKVLKQ